MTAPRMRPESRRYCNRLLAIGHFTHINQAGSNISVITAFWQLLGADNRSYFISEAKCHPQRHTINHPQRHRYGSGAPTH
jgi:hypothetical protein